MSAGGKGSSPRPYSVPKAVFESNWDKIFGGSKPEPAEAPKRNLKALKMAVKSAEVIRGQT